MDIQYSKDGVNFVFEVDEENFLKLYHCSALPYEEIKTFYEKFQSDEFRAVEVQISGGNHNTGHGRKYVGTSEGRTLKYDGHYTERENGVERLVFVLKNDFIKAEVVYEFYGIEKLFSSYTRVENLSADDIYLEYVSSFCYYGVGKNK